MRTSSRLLRPVALLVGALAFPLVFAACSTSATSSGSTTTTRAAGHQGASSACTFVSPAQIQSVLGRSVEAPTAHNGTTVTLCTYAPTNKSVPLDAVLIGYRGHVTSTVATAEQATLAKLHDAVTDVTGSGGQAYYYSVGSGTHTVITLVSLVGETQVTVTSTASVAQAEALSSVIFDTFAADAASTTTVPGATSTTTTTAG